jgi:hypothetical protein
MRLISMQVESAVLPRLKLLKRLLDVELSPEEAQALMQRVKTNTCRAEDRDRLAQVIGATTEVSDQLLELSSRSELPALKRPSSTRKAKRKRQRAKASRRRQRR